MTHSSYIEQKAKKTQKKPRKISPTYLHNAALAHLGRFACSSENLRRILHRKIYKSHQAHNEPDLNIAHEWVEELIEQFLSSALLDDTVYTQGCVKNYRRRGLSKRQIQAKLMTKGVPAHIIEDELKNIDKETLEDLSAHLNIFDLSPEMIAAFRLAKRRRLGSFKINHKTLDKEQQSKQEQKDLAALARAGFSYEIAYHVIKTDLDNMPDIFN